MISEREGLIVVMFNEPGGEKLFSTGCCGPIYCGVYGETIGGKMTFSLDGSC